jgi:hypothetical protein
LKQQPEVKENGRFPFLVTKRKREMELGSNRETENESVLASDEKR